MKDKSFKLDIIIRYLSNEENQLENTVLLKCENDYDEDFFDLKSSTLSEEIKKDIIDFANDFNKKYLKSFQEIFNEQNPNLKLN